MAKRVAAVNGGPVVAWGAAMALLGWAGCTGIEGASDAGARPDAGLPPPSGFSFSEPETVGPDDPSRNGGLALARNGAEISVLYFVDLTSTQTCTTPLSPPRELPESEIRLARAPNRDDGFTVRPVVRTRSADGVAAAYNPAGLLTALFAGGENGTGSCAASDLMQAEIPVTGMPTVTTVAADGNTTAMCLSIQNACNQGNVIGRFPQLLFAQDGTRLGCSMDTHFGFSQQSDLDGSDLEVLVGAGLVTVDNSTGAGNHASMFVAEEGRPAVAHVQIKEHTFSQIGLKKRGIWLARQKADLTWENILVAEVLPTNQIGAAYHPQRGYAVAYQDPNGRDLHVVTSVNGTTWTDEPVDVLGDVGSTPAVGFSGSALVVAYGACSGPNDPQGACVPERDGVRLAWRDGGPWNFQDVANDEEFLEGTDIRMVMDAQGNPTIAFQSQGKRRVQVVRGTRR
jgi:hypothetical protein